MSGPTSAGPIPRSSCASWRATTRRAPAPPCRKGYARLRQQPARRCRRAEPAGQTWNGGIGVPLRLKPGEQGTATFVFTWHFPNRYLNFDQPGRPRDQGRSRFFLGNDYTNRFIDAVETAEYVAREHANSVEQTQELGDRRLGLDRARLGRRDDRRPGQPDALADDLLDRGRPVLRLRRVARRLDRDVERLVRRVMPAELHPRLELRDGALPPLPRPGAVDAGDRVRARPGARGLHPPPHDRAALPEAALGRADRRSAQPRPGRHARRGPQALPGGTARAATAPGWTASGPGSSA